MAGGYVDTAPHTTPTAVRLDPPASSATTGQFVPQTFGLVRRTVALQTLDNSTAEAGMPLMVVIEL